MVSGTDLNLGPSELRGGFHLYSWLSNQILAVLALLETSLIKAPFRHSQSHRSHSTEIRGLLRASSSGALGAQSSLPSSLVTARAGSALHRDRRRAHRLAPRARGHTARERVSRPVPLDA